MTITGGSAVSMMRKGRLAYIKSYWVRARERPLEMGAAEMARNHIPELIAEIERLWALHPHDDPALDRPDLVCRRSDVDG